MENLLQDIRYGIRVLVKKPGFTFVAILTLALGIGANSAIFSVVNSVLLRPLPYKSPDKLVWIWGTNPSADIPEEAASAPDYLDWKTQSQSFESMAGMTRTASIFLGTGEPERIPGALVTDGYFAVLGVEPLMGRTFTPEEDVRGNHRVIVLSHGLWQRRFGGDSSIVGNTITLSGVSYTVVGVMPPDFKNPLPGDRQPAEFWMPLALDYSKENRRSDYLGVIARLKDGVSVEQARSDMGVVTTRLEEQYPNTNTGWSAKVLTLHERFVGDVEKTMMIILGAVCFLLLIACANVANLLLARAAARQKELAIRTALGAGRWRIIRQLLTESLVLSIVGGTLGLLLALWGVEALISLSPGNIPRLNEIRLDGWVLAFTFGISLFTGLIFGLIPAVQASRFNLNETLKEAGRGSSDTAHGGRVRSVLVVAEMALALVLLVGAGLMVRSFMQLHQVDPGFRPDRVLAIEFLLPRAKYADEAGQTSFYTQLLSRVSNLSGVETAGLGEALPLSGGVNMIAFSIEGRPQLQPTDNTPDAEYRVVSSGYFNTLGIPLVRGRLFNEQDSRDTPIVMVINETLARRHFPGEDPIGKRINLGNPNTSPWRTIVGIVADTRHKGLQEDPYPQMYGDYTQLARSSLTLVARTSSDPMSLVGAIRSQVQEMDKDQPLYNVRTMEQVLSNSIARPRFYMTLIAIFAGVAMVLAAVGIYGVISYSVTQRSHELGVRMALGANAGDIFKLVIKQGMALALIGVGLGVVGAFALTRLMESMLFKVSATDPVTFAVISLALIGVALVACFVPARRATKVDPMVALRYE